MPHHIAPEVIIDGTLYTLLAFSVVTWTLILFKIWQFTKNSFYNRAFNKAFWDAANLEQAKTLPVEVARGPQARIAQQGFAWMSESQQSEGQSLKYRGVPSELLEHSLLVQMQQEQHAMESGLTMLASIGSTSPFVGLFGTVLGIMHAMHEITASGSTSLDVVAGPIGDALVATAIGIAVAVPAVLAYNFFLRRVKQQRAGLENFVVSFMHIASSANVNGKE
ncbi:MULTISPECIES: MotA/TolQ/ExbB proton channel family protein [Methylobacter]|jgi:biopolymer transport protein ExbB|uniref:Biopolymer transport protein ExbB n=1 Tax=Methylobacter tundripaludum TaxID=173365 RepID=A0A2S6HK98_9GAMM|nr:MULTISPECIES: MotA/TolQ/ExbB proton channel family protein [Methylobacter]MDD4906243.1 MotA/TolQ/ExbB proton channel family protein [Methylobacter tundripaludum]MDI1277648.1 MotA/TolQ/ExbB proton channel family protein [Methylobacter sp.]MDI1358208.1 MotA/TolQ/ExbB proton channel family protein [Methylobacter sp.]PPK77918.1 biopolymer transport protein ExbB [Methylobacter tundripaludum]